MTLAPVDDWRMKHHLMFMFEVDTDALVALLPPQLDPAEVKPGISLIGFEWLHYQTGHGRDVDNEFDELVLGAAVHADLKLATHMPKYSVYALSILSSSQLFLDDECRPLWSPLRHSTGFKFELTQGGLGCELSDSDGPIATLHNTNTDASWERKTMWGQYFTDVGGLRQGTWRWKGEVFEHMHRGTGSKFHKHPFFRGLDLSRVHRVHRHMVARPGTTPVLTRWLPGVAPTVEAT